MDFWDLTKLLVRRWMIMFPMLVLSAALAVWTTTVVKPDYVTTAYVQLVPPVIGETTLDKATAQQRNPWVRLEPEAIGNAAIVTVTDRSVQKQMKALGYSASYTATMGETTPLVTFEIVGKSETQARATAEQLVERFSLSVTNLQRAYSVAPSDAITARRLDLGTDVEQSNSTVKRALIAVAAAGILLTIAVTVGIDAWLRRRQRRRVAVDAVPPAAMPNPLPQTLNADRLSPPSVRVANTPITSGGAANSRAETQSNSASPSETTMVLPQTRP